MSDLNKKKIFQKQKLNLKEFRVLYNDLIKKKIGRLLH